MSKELAAAVAAIVDERLAELGVVTGGKANDTPAKGKATKGTVKVTMASLVEKAKKLQEKDKPALVKILKKLGVAKFGEIEEEQFADANTALDAALKDNPRDAMQNAFVDLSNEHGKPAVKAILAQFEVEKIPEIKDEQIDEVIEAIKEYKPAEDDDVVSSKPSKGSKSKGDDDDLFGE
jgi:hypothetical protein